MRKAFLFLALGVLYAFSTAASTEDPGFTTGTPDIRSMSALAFGPDGVPSSGTERRTVSPSTNDDAERRKTRSRLEPRGRSGVSGTRKDDVAIHDMAVNPSRERVPLSRGRGQWIRSGCSRTNADASVRVKVDSKGA
jgi:hypothetical protein